MSEQPAPRSGGQILVDALCLHGVEMIFGVPGESYLAALDALYNARNQIKLITCRQEGGAAYMAEAYGKLTGRPGICFVTRGPGACNASIGVHTAMQDSTPLILLVGQIDRGTRGREAFQEIDYGHMFAPPIAKMAVEIVDPARIPEIMHDAFQTATSGRPGPVVVSLPEDMLTEAASVLDGKPYEPVQASPSIEALEDLRSLLERAQRPVMILGGGGWAPEAVADMEAFAEANGLPTAVSFRRQDLVNNDSDIYIGDLSASVDPKLVARVKNSDLLLVVGARLGEMTTRGYTTIQAPAPVQSLIHVYPDGRELGRVYQPDLAILSGMAEFASAAVEMAPVDSARWADWRASARADYMATQEPDPFETDLDMAEVIAVLRRELPADTIITVDAGNFGGWAQRFWRFTHPRSELGPTVGAMGYSVPAGIAAKLAEPERTVVSFVGDGGFLMTGQELATAVMYGAAPIILVVNNNMFGTIRMNQERSYPGRAIMTELKNPDFAALARAYDAHGERVTKTAEFAPALARARESGKAALIELVVDPEIITTRTTITALREAAAKNAT